MHVNKITIKNFRLLRKVELNLENRTTVVVGRNNSGKTSLTELFRRLMKDSTPMVQLEDFSLSVHEEFWTAFQDFIAGVNDADVRKKIPTIEVSIHVGYGKSESTLGLLADFIVDLNEEVDEAKILMAFEVKDAAIKGLFEGIVFPEGHTTEGQRKLFFRALSERIKTQFEFSVVAVDPNDDTNRKRLEWTQLRRLVHSGFINAQRGLDDITHRDNHVLGKILEALFRNAASDTADEKEKEIVKNLKEAVKDIQQQLDDGFAKQLQDLLPAISLFGYPGLYDPNLITETSLDVARLLTDNTKVHYSGVNGINLPEAYNGLGARNLIFILLKLLEYFKSYATMSPLPGVHLIFIEEPEVHLHPQMQEVFISKLGSIAADFAKRFNRGDGWPVQFIVTSHSSHLANKASFDSMRYFVAEGNSIPANRATTIKDLRMGLVGTSEEDRQFLHKYMTLTRCDLLFADKVVLVEGTTERILLPIMIGKLENAAADLPRLSSQYLTILEVGGAYAHIFFDLLKFLELPSLIVTDIDIVDGAGGTACMVSKGSHTSNACVKKWFGDNDVSPAALLSKTASDKTVEIRRLTYQCPDSVGAPCGRSFEASFMLANQTLFGLQAIAPEDLEEEVWKLANKVPSKSDFALEFVLKKTEWNVPKYIQEGLTWLAHAPKVEAQTGSTLAA